MSRVGNAPIMVPAGVTIDVSPENVVTVKGPKGELTQEVKASIKLNVEDNQVTFERETESKENKSFHGLFRSLINNMVVGVSEGFVKELEIVGVGYRADKQGDTLKLDLGYSHPIMVKDPEGVTSETPSQTSIIIKGIDKQAVGNYAAIIRAYRKPEPYKGKGVRYKDEYVRRKEGKAGAK